MKLITVIKKAKCQCQREGEGGGQKREKLSEMTKKVMGKKKKRRRQAIDKRKVLNKEVFKAIYSTSIKQKTEEISRTIEENRGMKMLRVQR